MLSWIVFILVSPLSKQPPSHQHKYQQLPLHKASCDLLLVMLVLCNSIIYITQSLTYSVLGIQDHQSLPDSPEAGQLLCLRAKPLTFSTWKNTPIFSWNRQAKNILAAYYIAAYLSLHAFSSSLHNRWLRLRFSYMRAWVWIWVMYEYSWLRCRKILLNENHISVWDCLPCRNILTSLISLIPSVVYKGQVFLNEVCWSIHGCNADGLLRLTSKKLWGPLHCGPA